MTYCGKRLKLCLQCLPLLLACLALASSARAEAVRELVSIQGAPPLTVQGYGVVTGLANTGDKAEAAKTLLQSNLNNIAGFNFDLASLETGNIAMVKVTGEIPPFCGVEQKFPVTISSVNGAKSLSGGVLDACDLYLGGVLVARAQGKVTVGSNNLLIGNVPAGRNSGALLLEPYPLTKILNDDFMLRLNLERPNWADAVSIARQINQTPSLNPNLMETTMFADAEPTAPVAVAANAGQVVVMIPPQYRYGEKLSTYIAGILAVPVAVDRPATIMVNRSLNSIVVTGDVRVSNAVVSLQDKTVTIRPETPEEPAGYTLNDDTPRTAVELEGPGSYADLSSLVDTMNAMGLSTEQIIAMFEELRSAGAINAELISQ